MVLVMHEDLVDADVVNVDNFQGSIVTHGDSLGHI